MTETPQNPAADLWSDYLDAETGWHDESGWDVHDIEGMNEAAHDIYLALVAAETERDALAAALVTMGVNPESVIAASKGPTT